MNRDFLKLQKKIIRGILDVKMRILNPIDPKTKENHADAHTGV